MDFFESHLSVGIFFGLNPGRKMRLNLVYSPFCDARECQRVCFSIPPGVHSDSDKFVLLSIQRPRRRPLDEPFIFLLILCFNAPSCPPNLIPSEHLTLKCFRLFSILFCVLRIFTFFINSHAKSLQVNRMFNLTLFPVVFESGVPTSLNYTEDPQVHTHSLIAASGR